jgi:hypothetical protein
VGRKQRDNWELAAVDPIAQGVLGFVFMRPARLMAVAAMEQRICAIAALASRSPCEVPSWRLRFLHLLNKSNYWGNGSPQVYLYLYAPDVQRCPVRGPTL